jgi:hypothetical protein
MHSPGERFGVPDFYGGSPGVKNLAVEHGPADITVTPTEPKHLGTRWHRQNHAKPASSPDPPPGYAVATSECAASQGRGRRGVASVKSRPARLLMGVASAHFSPFSMTNARHSKERRHVVEPLTSRLSVFHCRVPA